MTLPSGIQRWAIVLLPPVAFGLTAGLIIPKKNKLRQVNAEESQVRNSVRTYREQIEALNKMPMYPRVASLQMSRQEQSAFLRGLAKLCTDTGNRIVSMTSLAPPAAPPPAPAGSPKPPTKPDAETLPPNIVEIKSTIVFEGTFDSMRSFLSGIKRSIRLVALSGCRITPGFEGYPNLQVSLSVMRYVDAPPAAATPPAGGPPPAGKTT
jgi:hypothetical protein